MSLNPSTKPALGANEATICQVLFSAHDELYEFGGTTDVAVHARAALSAIALAVQDGKRFEVVVSDRIVAMKDVAPVTIVTLRDEPVLA